MSTPQKMDVATILMIAQLVIEIIKLWQQSQSTLESIFATKSIKKSAKKIGLDDSELKKLIIKAKKKA
jgi:hypothetical protein